MTPEAPLRFSALDAAHMARALALAGRGRCTTHPNPRVGCVIAHGEQVLGEGWHERAGGPHAEVAAIAAAGGPAACAGATAYVTLEPCNHHGRTPPCVDALLAAGLGRVVAAMTDPDPRTAGQGLERLASAGVSVASGLMEEGAARLNRGFLSRLRRGRPFVTLKLAQSLDGRVALANGQSQWLTGPAARRDVHRRRAESDVLLTGIGTVLADDPFLTVREGYEALRIEQPLRVVVDSRQRLPAGSRLASDGGRTLLVHAGGEARAQGAAPGAGRAPIECSEHPRIEARGQGAAPGAGAAPVAASARASPGGAAGIDAFATGVTRWQVAGGDGRVGLHALFQRLGAAGFNEVFAECGGTLAGALIAARLVDELLLYVAPLLLGADARPAFALASCGHLGDCPRWSLVEQRHLGRDLCLVLHPGEAA